MAIEQYQPGSGVTEGNLRPANTPYERIDATPGAFGAQVGRANQQLGSVDQQVATNLSQVARQMRLDAGSGQEDLASARMALVELKKRDIARSFDPDNGFYTARGADAKARLPGHLQSLNDDVEELGKGLTGKAQELFQHGAGEYTNSSTERAMSHTLEQQQASYKQAGLASIDMAQQDADKNYGNQDKFNELEATTRSFYRSQGLPREAEDLAVRNELTKNIQSTVQQMAVNNPLQAVAFLNNNRSRIDPGVAVRLDEALHGAVVKHVADGYTQSIIASATGGMSTGQIARTGDFRDNIHFESSGQQLNKAGTGPLIPAGFENDPDAPRGVSQIRPSTARDAAKAAGIPFDPDRLDKDATYNASLGAAHHAQLMKQFGGNKVLADFAYHNGADATESMLHNPKVGDPRTGMVTNAEWVQRVADAGAPKGAKYAAQVNGLGRDSQGSAVMNGYVMPDRSKVIADTLKATENEPADVQAATLAGVNKNMSEIEALTATKRAGIAKSYDDVMAAYKDGHHELSIPEADINANFPPAEARDRILNAREARNDSLLVNAAKTASLPELQATIDQLNGRELDPETYKTTRGFLDTIQGIQAKRLASARHDFASDHANVLTDIGAGKAVDLGEYETRARSILEPADAQKAVDEARSAKDLVSAEGEVSFASPEEAEVARQRILNSPTQNSYFNKRAADALTEFYHKRTAELEKDPVKLVEGSLAVQQARQSGDIGEYYRAISTAQARMGVPEEKRRLLSDDQVAHNVSMLTSKDPSQQESTAMLDNMAKGFGDQWPQAFKEMVTKGKLNPDFQVLGSMTEPGQITARQDFQRALVQSHEMGAEKFNRLPEGNGHDLQRELDSQLTDVQATLRYSSTGAFAGVLRPSVEKQAIYYIHQGQDPSTAVANAVDGIVNQGWDIRDTLRAPKGKGDAALIQGQSFIGGLKTEDLLSGDTSLAEVRQGNWYANDNGGMTLMVPSRRNAGWRPARMANGKDMEIKWSDVKPTGAPDPSQGFGFGGLQLPPASAQ